MKYFGNKLVNGVTRTAGWFATKFNNIVSTDWGAWYAEKMRKKTEEELEQAKIKKLEARVESDRCVPGL